VESFTISADGHYVGHDGFLVPKDFNEYFQRDPLVVRRWLTKRMRGRVGRDSILDLEQELLLYLCSLPTKSKFRRRGANGRADGCTDVIQCFDPVRHYGATTGRFHNFINLCLSNRLNTTLTRQRFEPLCHPNNLSISDSEPGAAGGRCADERFGVVSEEYLLNHARSRELVRKTTEESENMIQKIFIREFSVFAEQKTPGMLVIINAIQSTATLIQAQAMIRIDDKEFRKHRRQLSALKAMFLEGQCAKGSETPS